VGTRLVNLVIDSARPRIVAEFWAALLGWKVAVEEPEQVSVRAPASDGWALNLTFVTVPEAKVAKNRIHLDLASASAAEQGSIVDKSLDLGARRADIGQGTVPWVVLADPEGNEFCVLEPRDKYLSTGAGAAMVVDAHNPLTLASFWAEAAGWTIADRDEYIAGLRSPSGRGPWLEFLRTSGVKCEKNRVHLDVSPEPGGDHDQEAVRLCDGGATRVDLGGREFAWQVLADPEGNEFCVVSGR
jgi:predicted enzyme related to lactoylglutathione lyase